MKKFALFYFLFICHFSFAQNPLQWRAIPNAPVASQIQSVYFINPNTGWVCGGGGGIIYKSTNGGFNWSDLTPTPPFGLCNSICFVDALTGWFNDTERPENIQEKSFLADIFRVAKAEERYRNGEIGKLSSLTANGC